MSRLERGWEYCRLRLGRRGAMLTLMGMLYMLLGYGILTQDQSVRIDGAFITYVPIPIRAALWFGAGILALVFAWRKEDRVGWLALYIPATLRWASWISAYVLHLVPFGHEGYSRGFYNSLFVAPLIITVLICSGWKEPRNTKVD